jgi:hypothetical protein
MGHTVRVDVPAFAESPFRVVTSLPSAWIEAEHPFDTTPRYLLSLFVVDRPRLLRAVLTAVDEGVVLPAEGEIGDLDEAQRTVRFSIDGSLASSLNGAFMTAMVLRAIVPAGLARAGANLDGYVPTLLQTKVAEGLDGLKLPENAISNIEIQVFKGIGDRLFRDRRFTEYRFGASRSSSADAQVRLARMILQFSKCLGEHSVPIAYLYFPDVHHDVATREDLDWARIGVGAPARAVESMEIDLVANKLASEYGCVYRKYDPVRGGNSMDERFTLIADYEQYASSPLRPEDEQIDAGVDVVFAQGPARAGLVGQMLAGEAGPRLLAGSMTVLAGHTISSWVVPAGAGQSLIDDIRALKPFDTPHSSSELYALGPIEGENRPPTSAYKSYWAAWRCPDRPGVARRVVETIHDHIAERLDAVPDFRYMISRVLANGEACAGKLKFRVDHSNNRTPVVQSELLSEALRRALPSSPQRGEPVEVRVQKNEPGEEPWASLLVI